MRLIIFLFIYCPIKIGRTYSSFHAMSPLISTGHLVVINLSQWFLFFFCPFISHYKNFFVSCLPFSYVSPLSFHNILSFLTPPPPPLLLTERKCRKLNHRAVFPIHRTTEVKQSVTIQRSEDAGVGGTNTAWRHGRARISLAELHVAKELNETEEFNICFIPRFLFFLIFFFLYILSFSALYYVCCFVRICDLY